MEEKSTEEARQGRRTGVLKILVISLVLAIAGYMVVALFF